MAEHGDSTLIAMLEAKLKAQQKTIEALMNVTEQRTAEGPSSSELLSRNLKLEKVVQQKTETLQQQGEELKRALRDLQLTQARLLQAQKLESVGQLAAGIAHEINSPVQFIASNTAFLEDSFVEVKHLIDALLKLLPTRAQGAAGTEASRDAENLLAEIDWNYLEKEIPLAIEQSKEGIRRISTDQCRSRHCR